MEDGVWRIEDVPSSILVLGERGILFILFILSKAISTRTPASAEKIIAGLRDSNGVQGRRHAIPGSGRRMGTGTSHKFNLVINADSCKVLIIGQLRNLFAQKGMVLWPLEHAEKVGDRPNL
jgi:hypothetical protein